MVNPLRFAAKAVTHPKLGYVMENFAAEAISHPKMMARELYKCTAQGIFGAEEKPKPGLLYEVHSHSEFSDGAELAGIVNKLSDAGYSFWSLTDHGNTEAFDQLESGQYDLDGKSGRDYYVEPSDDGRFLTISRKGRDLVMLRSLEYMTAEGEIGIHGFKGLMPPGEIPLKEAIERATDGGAHVIINHPYFWEGLGANGMLAIDRALDAGAIALEKNATEIFPQIYSPVRAQLESEFLKVPIVASGDAHTLDMYGKSGITFSEENFKRYSGNFGNPVDAVRWMVRMGEFDTFLNYISPMQFMRFFSMDSAPKEH